MRSPHLLFGLHVVDDVLRKRDEAQLLQLSARDELALLRRQHGLGEVPTVREHEPPSLVRAARSSHPLDAQDLPMTVAMQIKKMKNGQERSKGR